MDDRACRVVEAQERGDARTDRYDRAGEPKTLIWTETEHVGARKAEVVEGLFRLIEGYLDGGGPRAARAAS